MGNQASVQWITNTENATIDDKGRLLFNKKKREALGEDFCITVGSSGCLEVYPKNMWEDMAHNISGGEGINIGQKQLSRMFFHNSEIGMNFDPQGRVVLPAGLKAKVGISKEVVVAGNGRYVEVWDRATYERYDADPADYLPKRELAEESAYLRMKGRWPELPRQQ